MPVVGETNSRAVAAQKSSSGTNSTTAIVRQYLRNLPSGRRDADSSVMFTS
jgi:hypothetical protein